MQVIEHPVERLLSALLSTQKDQIESYQQLSRAEKTFLEGGLQPANSLFSPITIHSDSDWIPAHPENPQDFQSFYINSYRRTPVSGHNTIYIQTIGQRACIVKQLKCVTQYYFLICICIMLMNVQALLGMERLCQSSVLNG